VKVVEAFARRLPVVATSLGAEGLRAIPERHLLVADTPAGMAQACVRLVGDPVLRQELRQNAFRLYQDFYVPKVMHEVLLDRFPVY
jgi:glycosyltransferase involved in cell wall biosynthesis